MDEPPSSSGGGGGGGGRPAHPPRCFVIVHNVSKRHNVGTLLRSATAFGVAEARC